MQTGGVVQKRRCCKSGRYKDDIELETLLKLTHLPSHAAARHLGLGMTVFKRLCRIRGINRWPYVKRRAGQTDEEVDGSNGDGPDTDSYSSGGSAISQEATGSRLALPAAANKARAPPQRAAPARPDPVRLQRLLGSLLGGGPAGNVDALASLASPEPAPYPVQRAGVSASDAARMSAGGVPPAAARTALTAPRAQMPQQRQVNPVEEAVLLAAGSIEELTKRFAANPGAAEQLVTSLQSLTAQAPGSAPAAPLAAPGQGPWHSAFAAQAGLPKFPPVQPSGQQHSLPPNWQAAFSLLRSASDPTAASRSAPGRADLANASNSVDSVWWGSQPQPQPPPPQQQQPASEWPSSGGWQLASAPLLPLRQLAQPQRPSFNPSQWGYGAEPSLPAAHPHPQPRFSSASLASRTYPAGGGGGGLPAGRGAVPPLPPPAEGEGAMQAALGAAIRRLQQHYDRIQGLQQTLGPDSSTQMP